MFVSVSIGKSANERDSEAMELYTLKYKMAHDHVTLLHHQSTLARSTWSADHRQIELCAWRLDIEVRQDVGER